MSSCKTYCGLLIVITTVVMLCQVYTDLMWIMVSRLYYLKNAFSGEWEWSARKKCGLSFASTLRAGEVLTTNPSVGPPEQVCRRRGSGSMGCEHHQGGAVPGKMWIGSSTKHCPDLAWRGASSAAIGLRGSLLGVPFSWSILFLCLCPFAPSPHSLLQSVSCLPSSPLTAPPCGQWDLPTNFM